MENRQNYKADNPELKVSPRYTDAFMTAAYTREKVNYRGYTLSRVHNEIRLLKKSRKLAAWNIVQNQTELFDNYISEAEKRMAKNFCKLPLAAEANYQERIQRYKQPVKLKYADEVIAHLENFFAGLPDEEINPGNVKKIVEELAARYASAWYDTGNPDHFADLYLFYVAMAESQVEGLLCKISDRRIKKLGSTPKVGYRDNYTEQELLNMMKIVPLKAQREGNLVTITDQDHMKFENLCLKAQVFAREHVLKQPPRYYLTEQKIQVCWWEKQFASQGFFLHSDDTKKELRPDTFINKLLELSKPKPKQQAKPSRLTVLIYSNKQDQAGNVIPMVRKIVPQLGIIEWIHLK